MIINTNSKCNSISLCELHNHFSVVPGRDFLFDKGWLITTNMCRWRPAG